jgi:predicted nucleic acid-binding protein
MNGYLVDTNIPSELTRKKPEPAVEAFLKQAGKDHVYMSVLSLGEIDKGIAVLPASRRRQDLEAWLEAEIRPWFAQRILPISAAIAERWGFLSAGGRLRGAPVAVVDGLSAATALENDLTLATRNSRDFADLGVAIINPWDRQVTIP